MRASRVCTLPRRLTISRSGRRARRMQLRRSEDVPTRAPLGSIVQRQPRRAAEGVARILALGNGRQQQARGQHGRHVLEAVHGQVRAAIEQRLLDLLHEQALATHGGQGRGEEAVPRGGHLHEGAPRDPGAAGVSSAATCRACQRASGLCRVAIRTAFIPCLRWPRHWGPPRWGPRHWGRPSPWTRARPRARRARRRRPPAGCPRARGPPRAASPWARAAAC